MHVPRTKLDPSTARRFRTGRPCLDFVHTGGVGRWMAAELIHDAAELGHWLAFVLDLPEVRARPRDVSAARALRAALWDLAQDRVGDRPLSPAQVGVVNAAAARPPLVPQLDVTGALTHDPPTATQALSSLARDAIDLLSGPLGDRIRTCAAPDCELLFVDASRPGQRRWCSMERCGSLAKMRAYRARGGY